MMTRRVFLARGGLALVSLGFAPSFLTRTVHAAPASGRGNRRKLLVAVFQRGAVDGLNVVVPFGETDYYASRPHIAIGAPGRGAESAVSLDGFFAVHPRLAPLLPLWRDHRLAIVHACGSPDSTRSHFDAQDFMETATPGVATTRDGWLNRCLQAEKRAGASPLRAVALTAELPLTLEGPAAALALTNVDGFGLHAGPLSPELAAAFRTEYASADGPVHSAASDMFEAMKVMASAHPSQYAPAADADYPATPFARALKQIAQLAKADVGLEVAFTELGGWDTHVNQGSNTGQLAGRLDDFARSLAAFARDLGDRFDDTVILTMSEFGRTVRENGNRGTDHGHGNAMFVIGGPVRGGKVYGRWPGLKVDQRYQERDLAITTDFRDVFAEVAVRHLGIADTSSIFPGFPVRADHFPGFLA